MTADPAERAPILERAGRAAANAVQADRAEAFFREAIELRRTMGDVPGRFRAIAALGTALIVFRRTEAAETLYEPAIAEAEGAADEADLASLICGLARIRSARTGSRRGSPSSIAACRSPNATSSPSCSSKD